MSKPASKLRTLPPDKLRARLRLPPQHEDLPGAAKSPAELLSLLQERALIEPSIVLLCYALPEREAVWWACMCVLHTAPAGFPPEQRRALDAAQAWVWKPSDKTRYDSAAAAKEAGYVSAAAFTARAAFAARLSDTGSLRAGRRVETAVRRAATWDGQEHARARMQRFISSGQEINAGGAGRLPAEFGVMSGVPAIRLHLATRRGPTGVAGEQREVTSLPFSIGRAPENDWTLPDPGRVLSKRHCRITANGETWLITDTSSNGTFLNGTALDPEVPHVLRNGDRVVFGTYEIEAMLGDGEQPEAGDAGSRAISLGEGLRDEGLNGDDPHGNRPRDEGLRDADGAEDRLTSDPFSALDNDVLEAARPSVGLPTDFDPLTPAESVTESPYAAPDHVPELESNFRPPRPSLELLPEDWNQDPDPRPPSQPGAKEISAPPPLVGLGREADQGWGEGAAGASPRPTPPPAPLPQGEGEQRPSSAPPTPTPPPATNTGDAAGFAAFVAGAGMAGASVADPGTTLAALGAAFRVVVSGLRRIMIARATIKGEFRIEQTMLRAAGNNPLKFSADDDDALAALLGTGRQGGMRPSQAIGEAMRDMRRHELAVAAAMQQAVRDVLAELEPERIMQEQSPGLLDRLSGWSERRAWQRYAARHASMMRALANDFDSVFGRSFGRAYEAALAELASQDVEADPP